MLQFDATLSVQLSDGFSIFVDPKYGEHEILDRWRLIGPDADCIGTLVLCRQGLYRIGEDLNGNWLKWVY